MDSQLFTNSLLSRSQSNLKPSLKIITQESDLMEQIEKIRHDIYAKELGQYEESSTGSLKEPGAIFVAATLENKIIGYISISRPEDSFRLSQFVPAESLRNALKDCAVNSTYEFRSLTILPEFRKSLLVYSLMFAATRWIENHGGTHILAIGKKSTCQLYQNIGGVFPNVPDISIGKVPYKLVSFNLSQVQNLIQICGQQIKESIQWDIDVPFLLSQETNCYHGGQSWGESGLDFNKRNQLIVADVLDSPFPPSPKVIEALKNNTEILSMQSPPTQSEPLIEAISKARGIKKENIIVSSGSSSLMFSVFPKLIDSQSKVLLLTPMYGEYEYIMKKIIKCHVDYFQIDIKKGLDLESLSEKAKNYDLLVMVNPNSPLGSYNDLHNFVKKLKSTKIWVDETYINYIDGAKSLETLHQPNLYVCKSMSKCYALSGVRVGYLAGDVKHLKSFIPPWSVSLPAQVAAIEALQDENYYSQMLQKVHQNRIQMENKLIEKGFEVLQGTANFFLVFFKQHTADEIVKTCKKDGVFLRNASTFDKRLGPGCIRIAVKTPQENIKLLELLSKFQ